jgi:putative Mg2+ transporter-C (MgtC) family protein
LVPFEQFAFNLGIALLLGACIGLEREWRQRDAGMRTSALVAVGAAMFTMASKNWDNSGAVAGQIITGIGFLGAGNIIKEGAHIKGLTTAAAIWAVASIGMVAGLGHTKYAVLAAATVLGINVIVLPIEHRFRSIEPGPPQASDRPNP